MFCQLHCIPSLELIDAIAVPLSLCIYVFFQLQCAPTCVPAPPARLTRRVAGATTAAIQAWEHVWMAERGAPSTWTARYPFTTRENVLCRAGTSSNVHVGYPCCKHLLSMASERHTTVFILKDNSTMNKTEAQIVSYGILYLDPISHQCQPSYKKYIAV